MSAISSDLWDGRLFLPYCRKIASHITLRPEIHDTSQMIGSWFLDNVYTPNSQKLSLEVTSITPSPLENFQWLFFQFIAYTCSTLNSSKEIIMVLISALFKLTAQDYLVPPNIYIIIKKPYPSLSKDQLPHPPSAEIKLKCCPWLQ